MPFWDSTMSNSSSLHQVLDPTMMPLGLLCLPVDKPTRQGLPSQLTPLPCILWPSLIQIVYSLTGSRIPSFQRMLLSPGAGVWPLTQLCLSAHSKVLQGIQQSTCKVYGHAQHMFLQFCHCYGLLPIPADQETLLYFATFLVSAKGLQHGTIIGYLYGCMHSTLTWACQTHSKGP